MKKNAILILVLAVATLTVISTGCERPPKVEMDTANAAFDSAKTMGAEMYLPEQFAVLQDSMMAAKENMEMQKSKTFPSYADAKVKFNNVAAMANEIMVATVARKKELTAMIETTVNDTKAILEENKTLIAEAPKGKEGNAALDAMKQEVSVIEASVNEASMMLQNNPEYNSILDKANAAKEKAAAMNTELKEVMAKFSKNSKPKKA